MIRTRTTKTRAFSTGELMVSGGVMLAITFLTMDVMVANAKISVEGVKATEQESDQRSGIEQLQKDLKDSEATVTKVAFSGGLQAKNNKVLILRKPNFDSSGNRSTTDSTYVIYLEGTAVDPRGKSVDSIIRIEGKVDKALNFVQTGKSVPFLDIKRFKYRTARVCTIAPTITGYPLPGAVTARKPSGGDLRILSAGLPDSAASVSSDHRDTSFAGLDPVKLAAAGLTLVGNTLVPVNETVPRDLDLILEVDEERAVDATNATAANNVRVWVTVKGRNKQPDTVLSAMATMKNAQ